MAKNKDIPNKLELTANDPFLKYLANMYNCGIDYMAQSRDILNNMGDYKNKLNEFMENNKLKDVLQQHLNKKETKSKET